MALAAAGPESPKALHFSTQVPVILLKDVKVAAISVDILRDYSLEGKEKADGLRLNLVRIKENRSFQEKDVINLLKRGGRHESTSATGFSISWQMWSCFCTVKSEQIRFPAAISSCLPFFLCYTLLRHSETASDHVLDSGCVWHACWRKQREQRAL